GILAPALSPLERGGNGGEQPRTIGTERVERARLDEALEHAAVERAALEPAREVEQVGERPALRARARERGDGRLTRVLDRAEPEADRAVLEVEAPRRAVHARRQQLDAGAPGLVDEHRDAIGV